MNMHHALRDRETRTVVRHTVRSGFAFALVGGALTALLAISNPARAADDLSPPAWGLDTPAADCVVCHTLRPGEPFRVAPTLYDIVGAEKARERDWYGYSLALMTKGGTWTDDDLDVFLENASSFAPGSTKSIRVTDAEERRRIIDFLRTLKP